MDQLIIKADKIIRVEWSNWNEICSLVPGVISEENQGKTDDSGDALWFLIPPNFSAVCLEDGVTPVGQTAYKGDWLLRINNKILVVRSTEHQELKTQAPEVVDLEYIKYRYPKFSKWQHYNGPIYIILGHMNMKSPSRPDYPPYIRYANVNNHEEYCRKVSDWDRSMTRLEL